MSRCDAKKRTACRERPKRKTVGNAEKNVRRERNENEPTCSWRHGVAAATAAGWRHRTGQRNAGKHNKKNRVILIDFRWLLVARGSERPFKDLFHFIPARGTQSVWLRLLSVTNGGSPVRELATYFVLLREGIRHRVTSVCNCDSRIHSRGIYAKSSSHRLTYEGLRWAIICGFHVANDIECSSAA